MSCQSWRPMQICEVSPYRLTEVSGITTVIRSLAEELSSIGHRTIIVTPESAAVSSGSELAQQIERTSASLGNLRLIYRTASLLWKRRIEWDLVHVHQAHPMSAAAAIIARVLGRPAVSTFHVLPPAARGLRRLPQVLFQWFQPLISSACVFVSEWTRYEHGGTGEVIRNGIDIEKIHGTLGSREALRRELGLTGYVIVFAGRQAKNKGYFDLLRAIHSLRGRGIDARLLTTGRTPDEEMNVETSIIHDLGLGPFIENLGEREDHLRYLAAGDVFALPSYQEGFPMALLEAMAAGLPVVATAVGGIPELVKDGLQGYLVAPGAIDALADALLKLALNPGDRSAFGRAALERAKASDSGSVAARYMQLFSHLRSE